MRRVKKLKKDATQRLMERKKKLIAKIRAEQSFKKALTGASKKKSNNKIYIWNAEKKELFKAIKESKAELQQYILTEKQKIEDVKSGRSHEQNMLLDLIVQSIDRRAELYNKKLHEFKGLKVE